MRLGKLLEADQRKVETLTLQEFSLDWLPENTVQFNLASKHFASGGSRIPYKAWPLNKEILKGDVYVMKKYKEEIKEDIISLFGSIETHARKAVQMSSLVIHLCEKFSSKCPLEFG